MPANKEFLYHYLDDYQDELKSLAEAIANYFDINKILQEDGETIEELFYLFPSVESLYVVNDRCKMLTKILFNPSLGIQNKVKLDNYYSITFKTTCENLKILNDIYVEKCVYMNPVTKSYVVPVIVPFISNDGKKLFLILKIDLIRYIKHKDGEKKGFIDYFSVIGYGAIGIFFLVIAVYLLTLAVSAFYTSLHIHSRADKETMIFEVIILLTLSLALLDLSKQIIEHEIVYAKDPTKRISIRKITARFLSSILIAISIELLLMVFKASILKSYNFLNVLFMATSVFLVLIGLSIFIYLGKKSEEFGRKGG